MTEADITASGEPAAPSTALFDAIVHPGGCFDEAFASTASPREHWGPLLHALNGMGSDDLHRYQERARRMRHEDGATYNLFDDATGRGIPWALELIPLPLTAAEWIMLESGLIQRARLLETILADVYGPQDLLKQGHLPAELVFANPRFLHACHGIRPAADRHLAYYAADLYRDRDGRFRVFRDFGANPAGLGYALENRIVISRIFPQLYHQNRIHRLAPFFHTLHTGLTQRSALHPGDPGIVLLTPGPGSRIYFEHALLSRYLGYPLVEDQDLTVRNGSVSLRKLAGLEPVGSVFRHLSDDDSDPLALRRGTGLGIAGIIQASREGRIGLANPIGSGFVETPALAACLPGLCRRVLGEPLQLADHPSWWCGTADGLNHVRTHLDQLTLRPAVERTLVDDGDGDRMAAIQAAPYRYMAMAPMAPAAVPAWSPEGPAARRCLLRMFVCATARGFSVMPGGLAITAADVDTLLDEAPERQQSKDVWFLSDRPVEPFSLLGGLQTVTAFRRGSDLPSRVADHLLWLGRYLERAEGLIRLLRSVFRRLVGEDRATDIEELPFLLNLLRVENTIPRTGEDAGSVPMVRELTAQLQDALYRRDRPESVAAVLQRVQAAARNVRDRLSLDAWRAINRLDGYAHTAASDPLELLNDTLFTLNAFSGLAMESMTRGLGWRFMDMGRRIERGLNQAGLIRAGLPRIAGQSRGVLEALLEVFDSIMTYRARYRATFQPAPVLDLLIADPTNPQSLAFQCAQLIAHAAHLPPPTEGSTAGAEVQLAREMQAAVDRIDLAPLTGGQGGVAADDLAAFLESMERRLKRFAQRISAHYLTRVPTTPHFSLLAGEGRP